MSTTLLLAGVIVTLGAIAQGMIGYGLNLLAGPLLAMLDPLFVPVPVLVLACVQAALSMMREHGHTQWSGVGWAMLGRLPGNALGALAVSALPPRGLSITIALSVLACITLSLGSWRPLPNRASLIVAGTASGAFGTVSSIGGPPVALLYQHSSGPTIRATLGAFFVLGSVSSLITLGIAGQIRSTHIGAAAALIPFVLLGFALSGPLRKLLDGRAALRHSVLVMAALGAFFLIGRSVFG